MCYLGGEPLSAVSYVFNFFIHFDNRNPAGRATNCPAPALDGG